MYSYANFSGIAGSDAWHVFVEFISTVKCNDSVENFFSRFFFSFVKDQIAYF